MCPAKDIRRPHKRPQRRVNLGFTLPSRAIFNLTTSFMRILFLLALIILGFINLDAQLNATLRDQLDYPQPVNDIWGYVAPDGTEYAIVGLEDGVSFVSLSDPDNVVEVAFIPGQSSPWRDMKTFGEYAYSVADEFGTDEGITAFDLRDLPNSVSFNRTTYTIDGRSFQRAHNLYIDTLDGVLITAGGSRQIRDGGPVFFDLKTDPMSPRLIAPGPAIYAHDVYVLGDTLYSSELYRGDLALYDVTDYTNPIRLGSIGTPFDFTHNAWATADGRYVFTTDEVANASVAAYDVSDKNDLRLIDEYRPFESLNTGTVPHNAHVIDEYISISYYTDGLRVVDASKPDNLIEVANYDTWLGAPGDFNGNWGAFPYLPSGLTLVTDRSTGLYVVDVNYKRAARLEGTITDEEFGTPVNNVSVVITAGQGNGAFTDALGRYKTGLADGGTYTITISAPNYASVTVDRELINGECILLDTFLRPISARFDMDITVLEDVTNSPLPGAQIRFESVDNDDVFNTGPGGNLTRRRVFDTEVFNVYVTNWGHRTVLLENVNSRDLQNRTVFLPRGYMDDFVTDEGWMVTEETATTGLWERGVPNGTNLADGPVAPGSDDPNDIGDICWITGNQNANIVGADDVDDGVVTFVSPPFGPINFEDSLVVSYSWWFNNPNRTDGVIANDSMTVAITDGIDTVTVGVYEGRTASWKKDSFLVNDFLPISENLQLIVSTADDEPGHWVEAGFDAFNVRPINARPVSTDRDAAAVAKVSLFPNPSAEAFTLRYDAVDAGEMMLRLTDVSGRLVPTAGVGRLAAGAGTVRFGRDLIPGIYFVELYSVSGRVFTGKVVKR